MKSPEEFEILYETELIPMLEPLEKRRRTFLKKFFSTAIFTLSSVSVFFFLLPSTSIFIGIGFFIAGWIICRKLQRNFINDYTFRYKSEIVNRMIQFIDVRLNYDPESGILLEEFENSLLFPQAVSWYATEDCISGTIGKTDISFAEIHAKNESRDSDGSRMNHDLFRGLFFIANFNKHFTSRTIIVPDFFGDALGRVGRFLQKNGVWGGSDELIKLEDPEFEKYFAVYGSDPIDAKHILSPSLMSRILKFRKESGYIWISFVNGKLYLALPIKGNLFEPRIFKSVMDAKSMKKYFNYVTLMVSIVEELNLNARQDESILTNAFDKLI